MITAKFIGTSSSGFARNHTYNLILRSGDSLLVCAEKDGLIKPGGTRSTCVYDTWQGFLRNWEVISMDMNKIMHLNHLRFIGAESLLKEIRQTAREIKINSIL